MYPVCFIRQTHTPVKFTFNLIYMHFVSHQCKNRLFQFRQFIKFSLSKLLIFPVKLCLLTSPDVFSQFAFLSPHPYQSHSQNVCPFFLSCHLAEIQWFIYKPAKPSASISAEAHLDAQSSFKAVWSLLPMHWIDASRTVK